MELDNGIVGTAKFSHPLGAGPAQVTPDAQAQADAGPAGLTFARPSFPVFDVKLPIYLVGTDPAQGAATTTIPTTIVPLKFVFANGATLDGGNVVDVTRNSPLFQPTAFSSGGVDLGVTQYGDAIQRAEFWNLPGFSPDYHVLLGQPDIADTVTVVVPASKGLTGRTANGGLVGLVDLDFFDNVISGLYPAYSAAELPIFLVDNVFLYEGTPNQCCILGYHNSEGGSVLTAHTWIYSAHVEPGTFQGDVFVDTVPLSHEVAEWLNDPFVGDLRQINWVPPYVLPGQGGACQPNFETGDALEAPPRVFTQVLNGFTYHLQDEAFLPWFLPGTQSFSVNSLYTFLGTFTSQATLCGPG